MKDKKIYCFLAIHADKLQAGRFIGQGLNLEETGFLNGVERYNLE
jgi:hypothetical protein